jgi:hypothetical protein
MASDPDQIDLDETKLAIALRDEREKLEDPLAASIS